MRKILGRKFWSLGTPLGSLGPLSQGDVIVGPYGLQIPVIWGPYEPPVLVACQATAENPKSVGSWCEKCSKPQIWESDVVVFTDGQTISNMSLT